LVPGDTFGGSVDVVNTSTSTTSSNNIGDSSSGGKRNRYSMQSTGRKRVHHPSLRAVDLNVLYSDEDFELLADMLIRAEHELLTVAIEHGAVNSLTHTGKARTAPIIQSLSLQTVLLAHEVLLLERGEDPTKDAFYFPLLLKVS
jgi:hypothetical protein